MKKQRLIEPKINCRFYFSNTFKKKKNHARLENYFSLTQENFISVEMSKSQLTFVRLVNAEQQNDSEQFFAAVHRRN